MAEKYRAQIITRVEGKRCIHPVVQVGGNVGVKVDLVFHILQSIQTCSLQSIHSGLDSVRNN